MQCAAVGIYFQYNIYSNYKYKKKSLNQQIEKLILMPRFYGFIILNPKLKFESTTSMQNSERQISKIREKMITQKHHNHKNYITTKQEKPHNFFFHCMIN